jgi:hypothetical protein
VARYLAMALAVLGAFYSLWLLLLAFFMMFMAHAEEVSVRARRDMGDPGYQDAASQQGAAGTAPPPGVAPEAGPPITRTDWEVILPSDVRRPPPSSGNNE